MNHHSLLYNLVVTTILSMISSFTVYRYGHRAIRRVLDDRSASPEYYQLLANTIAGSIMTYGVGAVVAIGLIALYTFTFDPGIAIFLVCMFCIFPQVIHWISGAVERRVFSHLQNRKHPDDRS